jgi:DNA-binding ferritin-like protein (Dps family)
MRGSGYYSQHEASQYRAASNRAEKSADSYREKYLQLKKEMREYSRGTGHVFPDIINKSIGLKA